WWRGVKAPETPALRLAAIVGAAAVVFVLFFWFFHGARFPWSQEPDWLKDWTYYSSLRDAVLHGRIPYDLRSQFFGADRYCANPETLLTPDALLLGVMSINAFVTLHMLLCVAVGFWGLLALKRELDLSLPAWTIFLIVFLLNGHIGAHFSVGHVMWTAYYLLP